jgi:hypothetical protein
MTGCDQSLTGYNQCKAVPAGQCDTSVMSPFQQRAEHHNEPPIRLLASNGFQSHSQQQPEQPVVDEGSHEGAVWVHSKYLAFNPYARFSTSPLNPLPPHVSSLPHSPCHCITTLLVSLSPNTLPTLIICLPCRRLSLPPSSQHCP